jgi:hypothetical protein
MGNGDDKKTCFIIGPIGDPESETRKRSNKLLKHVIAKAVGVCGFKALRADQIAEPGIITTQVIEHVIDDPLVVADLTESNANVFYELALRHAARKPLVQLIRKGDRIPFDVGHMRTIPFDLTDPDSVEQAVDQMVKQIYAALKPGTQIETPITRALDLKRLDESGDPQLKMFGQILSTLSSLEVAVQEIKAVAPHTGGLAGLLADAAARPVTKNRIGNPPRKARRPR